MPRSVGNGMMVIKLVAMALIVTGFGTFGIAITHEMDFRLTKGTGSAAMAVALSALIVFSGAGVVGHNRKADLSFGRWIGFMSLYLFLSALFSVIGLILTMYSSTVEGTRVPSNPFGPLWLTFAGAYFHYYMYMTKVPKQPASNTNSSLLL
jgi:hypothetical protein